MWKDLNLDSLAEYKYPTDDPTQLHVYRAYRFQHSEFVQGSQYGKKLT